MSRKKLKEEDKKKKILLSIDNNIYEKLNDYISKNDINRTVLIEKLLKEYISKN